MSAAVPGQETQATVSPDQAGQRLDAFLAAALDTPRAQVQKWIEDDLVRLESPGAKALKPSFKVKPGMRLSVKIPAPVPLDLQPEDVPLSILFQDEHMAVVDKPRGMPVHPAPGHARGTLVHALLHHLDHLSGIGGVQRPGIVHRLDRTTSGLLVIAKTDKAHHSLSEQFRHRTAGRIYFALCWGKLEGVQVVDQPIARHPVDRKKMAIVPGGRRARTTLRAGRAFAGLSEMQAKLDTGRTHQIRVHAAFLGHPVAGDTIYGPTKPRGISSALLAAVNQLDGCALHAQELRLIHPATGQKLRFKAPLPTDLAQLVENLASGRLH